MDGIGCGIVKLAGYGVVNAIDGVGELLSGRGAPPAKNKNGQTIPPPRYIVSMRPPACAPAHKTL